MEGGGLYVNSLSSISSLVDCDIIILMDPPVAFSLGYGVDFSFNPAPSLSPVQALAHGVVQPQNFKFFAT